MEMWLEKYEEFANRLRDVHPEVILTQLEQARAEAPELYAAFNLISLPLIDEVLWLDSEREDPEETILNIIPESLIKVILDQPLVRDTVLADTLCGSLNRWATRVWWRKLLRGVLEEPAHFCDE